MNPLAKDKNPGPYRLGHLAALRLAADIAANERQLWWPRTTMIYPLKLMAWLRKEKIKFVLLGTYAIAGWLNQPRATHDIDLLIKPEYQKKLVRLFLERYPQLSLEFAPNTSRLIDPADGINIVDVFCLGQNVTKEFFANTIDVDQQYHIPNLELALVAKYRSMTSPARQLADKYQDASDFMNMVLNNCGSIVLTRLQILGDEILSAGTKLVRLVKTIQVGRQIQISNYF